MKLSNYVVAFAATALSAPVQITTFNTNITARDNFNSMQQCGPSDRDYPERSVYESTVASVCTAIFNGQDEFKVQFGSKRMYYDVEVFSSTAEKKVIRPMSFEIFMKDTKWPSQAIDEKQCVSSFTQMWQGPEDSEYKPCWTRLNDDGEKVELIRSWEFGKHREGFGDAWFMVYPGY